MIKSKKIHCQILLSYSEYLGVIKMIYGYARVSTKQQIKGNSLAEQVEQLQNADCDEIIQESYTGKTIDRPKFNDLLDKMKSGDTLKVTKLDRLCRSALEGGQIIKDLNSKGITIEILNMGKFDNSPIGKVVTTMLLAFAEFERDLIIERTQSGKDVAKLRPDFREGRPNNRKNTAWNFCKIKPISRLPT